jgi:2,3-bisphosphoglycerate-dependent phosphoglycerate mutase
MPTVWLIRHGESEANAGLPTIDPSITPITAKGERQAQQVAQAFTQPPALIVTSPYHRTQQTAQPTRARFPTVPHAEWPVQEFTYLAPARYRGSTIEHRLPLSDAYWQRNDPVHLDGVGAESFADLLVRVQITQTKLIQSEENFVAIFSHGRFIRAFIWAVLTRSTEATPKRMRQFQSLITAFSVPNGSILKLHVQNSEIWFNGIYTDHLSDAALENLQRGLDSSIVG